MAKRMFFLVALISMSTFILPSKIKKVVSIYYVEEEADGKSFSYQSHMANMDTKKNWKVDGKDVSIEEFYQKFAEAKVQEWLKERKKEEELQLRNQQEVHNLRLNIEKQEMRLRIIEVVNQIRRATEDFSTVDLGQYYVFDESTISSEEEFKKIFNNYLVQANVIKSEKLDHLDLNELRDFCEKFVSCGYKVRQFFLDSVNNAVDKCRDTKTLKEFLKLLS